MIELARPGFLLAGALAAVAPVVLHLIVRRPTRRVAFPTARFLRPDPRLAVRLQRRPTDLLLLLLRSAWLVLLGLALAAPSWQPRRVGTVEVVLLDRGGGMAAGWGEAVDAVRRVGGIRGVGSVRDGEAGAEAAVELVLFDTVAARVPASALSATFLDSLAAAGPGEGRVVYAVALRALAEVVRGQVDADSFRVTLVTRPRWEGWSAGLGALRAAVWPGVIRVAEVGAGAAERPGGGVAERPEAATEAGAAGGLAEVIRGDSAISGEQTGRGYVEAALKALGWEVGVGEVGELVIVPSHDPSLPHDEQREVLARAGAGATVVVAGEPGAGPLREALPWVWPAGGRGSPGALILGPTVSSAGAPISAGAPMLTGAESRFPGHPRPGARLLAVWEDGRPAAAAAREGTGCLVYLATGLEAGELPLDPGFPALLDRLLRGCDEGRGATRDERPLDLGGRRVLAGGFGATVDGRVSDGAVPPRTISAAVASAALGKVPGWPLGGWVLLVAFAVAVAETVLAYRGRGA